MSEAASPQTGLEERLHPGKLQACVEAARRSHLDRDEGPDDPVDHAALLARLDTIGTFPGVYQALAIEPLRASLARLGAEGLTALRARQQGDMLVYDLAQALSQRQGSYHRRELMAFQEVVNDLFDGFLSNEDRRGLKPPDRRIPAPLVKWGRPDIGPYALGVDQMAVLGVGCGVVSLPGAVARADGLFGWGLLGHETAGHGVLACERGLVGQLGDLVAGVLKKELPDDEEREILVDHWSNAVEELAADVLGVLNMGPAAAAAGLVVLRATATDDEGVAGLLEAELIDRHPVPVLRLVAMAEVLRQCGFGRTPAGNPLAYRLAAALDREAEAIVGARALEVGGRAVGRDNAFKAAQVAGRVVAIARVPALGGVSLRAVQTWRDRDQWLTDHLRRVLRGEADGADLLGSDFYAAHVVAAAILEALHRPERIPLLHRLMVDLLNTMHDANPSWGPLSVLYGSDLAPRRAGGIPKPFGTGAGGIPRPFAAALAGLGTGNIPKPFDTGSGGIPYPYPYALLMASLRAGAVAPPGSARRAGRGGPRSVAAEQSELPFPLTQRAGEKTGPPSSKPPRAA